MSTAAFEPAYVRLLRSGEWADRARRSRRQMENCDLCARYCRVNRLRSIRGAVCRTGERAVVYSAGPHHGEEECLRGWHGSGTIFFSWCNLRCVYCQNWEISWQGEGQEASDEELAQMMLRLQALGCHNVNLVTPSPTTPSSIASASRLSYPPVLYTSGSRSPRSAAISTAARICATTKLACRMVFRRRCQSRAVLPRIAVTAAHYPISPPCGSRTRRRQENPPAALAGGADTA